MWQNLKHPACFIAFSVFAISLVTATGCNQKTDDQPSNDDASASSDPISTTTNSVAVAKTTNLASPATSPSELPSPDSDPAQVCERFLKLLQSGNRIGAENLLTRTALTATTAAGLKLEPMGGPTSTYRIGDVRYATNQQKLAHVDTYVVDQIEGEAIEMEVTWQLHKHGHGWRISGVMLEIEGGSTKDLLSLENKHDVAKLQSLAGVEELEQTETRQAKALTDDSSSQIQ